MYYLTVKINKEEAKRREPFDDFGQAISACLAYYQPRPNCSRAVLQLTTELINGVFARAYAELNRPENIIIKTEIDKWRYQRAAKDSNSFIYEADLFFLIESEVGIADLEQFIEDEA